MTSEDINDAWKANNKVNFMLLELCPDKTFELKPGKGKTIRSNFVHIIGVRRMWIETKLAKKAAVIPRLDWKTATRDEILAGLETSSALMEALFEKMSVAKKPSKIGVLRFFAYCVAHEANHRSQVEIALRINGMEPDDAELYRLWEWAEK